MLVFHVLKAILNKEINVLYAIYLVKPVQINRKILAYLVKKTLNLTHYTIPVQNNA